MGRKRRPTADSSASARPATAAPSVPTRRRCERSRALRRALLRRAVLHHDRIDVLATQVGGYEVRPFHLDLLRFQTAHRKSLQLAPRGFGKSTMLNIARCLHEVLRDPNVRVLVVSNTQLQAEVFLREVKYHLEHNPILRAVFGEQVSEEKWDVREILVRPRTSRAKESTISCIGVYGAAVSRHYDVIVADDLVDEENSRTEGQRDRVREWFYRSLLPTLEPHGRIHLLGTRYHFMDLYGALIEGEYAGCHQVLKAIDEKGESPWPEKFSIAWLEQRRTSMGTMLFNGQYQNDVEAMKGRLFKAEWLRWYDSPPAGDPLRIHQGVDLAISQRETADFFAHVTIGVDRYKNVYVLDALHRRLTFKAQTDLIIERQRTYRPVKVLVEAVAYQQAQVEELRRAGVYAHAVKTSRDKVTRFVRLAARFEAGQVFLRRGMHDDLVEELLLAPEGNHDDLVDALEMAVSAESGLYDGESLYPDTATIVGLMAPDRSSRPRAADVIQGHEWRPSWMFRDGWDNDR